MIPPFDSITLLLAAALTGLTAGWMLRGRRVRAVTARYSAKLSRVSRDWETAESQLASTLDRATELESRVVELGRERERLASLLQSAEVRLDESRSELRTVRSALVACRSALNDTSDELQRQKRTAQQLTARVEALDARSLRAEMDLEERGNHVAALETRVLDLVRERRAQRVVTTTVPRAIRPTLDETLRDVRLAKLGEPRSKEVERDDLEPAAGIGPKLERLLDGVGLLRSRTVGE